MQLNLNFRQITFYYKYVLHKNYALWIINHQLWSWNLTRHPVLYLQILQLVSFPLYSKTYLLSSRQAFPGPQTLWRIRNCWSFSWFLRMNVPGQSIVIFRINHFLDAVQDWPYNNSALTKQLWMHSDFTGGFPLMGHFPHQVVTALLNSLGSLSKPALKNLN